jgi:hypothetical protein
MGVAAIAGWSMLASLLAALLALAPPEPSEPLALAWHAPAQCGTRDGALDQLRELLPSLPAQLPEQLDGHDGLEVEVALAGQPDHRYVAVLRFRGARGLDERTIEGTSCATLVSATVLIIALTYDPIATVEQLDARLAATAEPEPSEPEPSEPEPSEPEPSEPEPSEPEPSEPAPSEPEPSTAARKTSTTLHVDPTDASSPPIRVALGLLGGGGWGPIRAGMGTLGLELGVLGPRWRLGLRGLVGLPRTLDADRQRAVRYDAWLLHVRGCYVPTLARDKLELPGCLAVEAGLLRGRGVGDTPNPRLAAQPWLALALGPGLRYVPHPRVALGLELDAVVGLVRGGFTVGSSVVQQQANLGVRVLIGVELRLP